MGLFRAAITAIGLALDVDLLEVEQAFYAKTGDSTGTPGTSSLNTPAGRSAFAASTSTCTINNNLVSISDHVFVQLRSVDATLSVIKTVVVANGSFTVTGNVAATGAVIFSWFVVKSKT